jgi:hypothetical protein
MQLATAQVRTTLGDGGYAGISTIVVRLPQFDTSNRGHYFTASFRPWLNTKFGQPVKRPSICIPFCRDELPTYYSVPAGQTYEDIVGALKGHYREH